MGRWRPPAQPGSPYLTAEGARRLRAELDDLWRVQRPEVTRALAAAAAEGDRSENAEYTYRKKQLAGIDRRVRYLRRRMEACRVVADRPRDEDRVFFGAWFGLEDGEGNTRGYRIVGPDEFDLHDGGISMDSPLGQAVMGKAVGEEFEVPLPDGTAVYVVTAVSYDGHAT